MMVRLMVLVIALSMTSWRVHLAVAAEVLADPVEDHHRFVHRIAQHRQHRRQHRQRELPLEEGEEAQDDDHVVQVGDDRRDRELPLEAERQVDHDADHHHGQRLQRRRSASSSPTCGPTNSLRDSRTGSALPARTPARRRSPCRSRLAGDDLSALGLAQLAEDAAHDVAFLTSPRSGRRISTSREVPKFCTCTSPKPSASTVRAHLADVGRLRVAHLHHGAAGELDRQVQAARGQEEHRGDEGQERDDVEHQRVPHERDVAADPEELHLGLFSCSKRWSASGLAGALVPGSRPGRSTRP